MELRDQLLQGAPATVPICPSTSANRGKIFTTADGQSATFISDDDIYDSINPGSPTQFGPYGYLKLKDGTVYRIDEGLVTWMRDRNGNKLSFTYTSFALTTITDSLNRQITIEYGVMDPTYGYCNRIHYTGYNSTPRTIYLTIGNLSSALRPGAGYSVQSPHSLFPELRGASTWTNDPYVLTGVYLPNGRGYKFYYNNYYEIARVELPTGGAVEYDWGAGLTGGPASGATCYSCFPTEIYRRLLERRVYSNGGTGNTYDSRMSYSRPETYNSSGYASNLGYVTVNQYNSSGTLLTSENHYYYGGAFASMLPASDPTNYSPWEEGKEYQTDFLASDGQTVLRRVNTNWAQRYHLSWWGGSGYDEPSADPIVASTSTTLTDTNQVSQTIFAYDQFNNQTDSYEYDYGQGAAGALLRHTHTDYLTTNPVNGLDYTSTNIHIRNLPTQTSVYDGGGERSRTTYEYDNYASDTYHAALVDCAGISGMDAGFTTSYGTRGNATRVSRWRLSNGTSINSYAQYDIAGNTVKRIDGRGLVSQVQYSSTYQYAYPTHTISPTPDIGNNFCSTMPLETTTAYDFSTGLVTSVTDANGQTASVQYNDALERPTTILRPDGGWTVNFYNDTPGLLYVNTRSLLDPTRVTDSYQYFDSLGRPNRTALNEGGGTWLFTETQYDALGRVWKTANPYRSGTPVWTTTQYDALGRPTSLITPDGAQVTTAYSGNQMTVTDPEGKSRRSVTDNLGRLRSVVEDPTGLAYQTDYDYDALSNLRAVNQGTQHRYFMYDSLSRLIRAKYPEQDVNPSLALTDPVSGNSQWSAAYDYDNNGNISVKTDARGITATFAYDNINRNISVSYSDGTHIDRIYDSATNGRGRWRGSFYYVNTGAHSHTAVDNYDAMGRPLYQRQHFFANGGWGTPYVTQQAYDFLGHVTSETYPSGRVVNYSYDAAGRTNNVSGNLGDGVTRTYTTSISYDEWGGIYKEQFGTDTPLYHKEHRNVRGQLYDIRLSTVNDDLNWNRGAIVNYYSFQPYGFGTSGPDNNGNLLVQQNWVPTDDAISSYSFMQENYGYDSLNRLNWLGEYQNGATMTGSQGYTYDRYGNRTLGGWGAGINTQQFTVDTNTNRLGVPSGQSGVMQYDANGNLTYDTYSGAGARTYDPENRIVTATNSGGLTSTYTYDSDGLRVRRSSYNQETWQVYGMGGELVAEYAANAAPSSPQKEYGYRSGQLLVAAAGSADVRWMVSDQLGTPRMIADRTGSLTGVSRHDYLPFGEELFAGSGGRTSGQGYQSSDGVRQHFTGYERDAETGLDFAQARFYSSPQGRFTSIDPLTASAHVSNPQSWNRYAYVGNNPLNNTDPTGMAENGVNDPVVQGTPAYNDEQQRKQPPAKPLIDCSKVTIEADVDQKPKIVENKTIRDAKGKAIGKETGVFGTIMFTVKFDGLPAADVKVTESNQDTDTKNGKIFSSQLIEGYGTTNESGQVGDEIGHYETTDGSKVRNNAIKSDLSNNTYTFSDTQTLTLNFPRGGTCSATSTRVLTNAGPNGPSLKFTLTTTQPVMIH
jgi:RHS repeat-associated protein